MDDKVLSQSMARKPYQKPSIERVRLVAEEAVLNICKLSSGDVGPNGVVDGCVQVVNCVDSVS